MKTILFYFLLFFFTGFISCKKNTVDSNCVQGTISTSCNCPLLINYVCGCNNQTYENSCEAACAGITSYKAGRCP